MQIAGRSFQEWEIIFKSKIEERLKQERLDSLVYEITETVDVGNYVIKKRGEDRVERGSTGTTTILAPIRAEPASPTRIDLKAPIKPWKEDPRIVLDFLFLELAREVAQAETETVLNALLSVGKQFTARHGPISTTMLQEPYSWAQEHRQHLDTLVVHPTHEARLLTESKEFLNAWQLPERVRFAEGPHFSGILGGWNVYWTPFISEQTLLLYGKMEVREKRSPLSLQFIPREDPTDLQIREDCLAWAVDDFAVAVIRLEKGGEG